MNLDEFLNRLREKLTTAPDVMLLPLVGCMFDFDIIGDYADFQSICYNSTKLNGILYFNNFKSKIPPTVYKTKSKFISRILNDMEEMLSAYHRVMDLDKIYNEIITEWNGYDIIN